LKSLRLVNIRSFADSQAIAIAPLTLLVGQNSSGKSTFARFFPLLRQTSEVLAREPLLWLGRFVDFGSAEEAASKLNQNQAFGADIQFTVDRATLAMRRRGLVLLRGTNSSQTPVLAAIRYLTSSASEQSYRFDLEFFGHAISMETQDSKVTQLKINGLDYSAQIQGRLFASTWSSCFPNLSYKDENAHEPDPFYRLIFSYARSNTHGKSQTDRVAQLTRALLSAPLDDLLNSAKAPNSGDSTWQKTTTNWHDGSHGFIQLKNWIVGARIIEILQIAAAAFTNQCARVRYITPIRASAERYYRRQGLALGEIDPQGQNVAMFIHNMAPTEKQRFSSWMAEFFGYFVDTVATQGHISMVMRGSEADGERYSFNLADTGFGFSQMIPVLIQLWNLSGGRVATKSTSQSLPISVISIEQPELHLHPKLQARLADLFIQAIAVGKQSGVDLRLVVETHSEQIINRIGKRVAERHVQPEDVSLVLFDKPSFGASTRVIPTTYDEEGLVNNWPYGFFESDDQ